MVKRAKSPDVPDEARYFTVCQPFPLNANWIFDKDQRACATWIAECIGLKYLHAIHYKPSSRAMVLLEVSKEFTEHELLLGEHRWSEILTEPEEEEKKCVSQVFHSFYAKGRDAQKDGWKNIGVQPTWFVNWSPGEGRFKQPYPQTHWCVIPVEDKTNKNICRPLPVDIMAPPPRVEPPVVGSATWAQTKNTSRTSAQTLSRAWDEDISFTDVVNKRNEPAQPDAGSSIPVLIEKGPATTSLSTASAYPPLAGLATSPPNKIQPNSTAAPPRNDKKQRPLPLNQFLGGAEGGKRTTLTRNKPAAKSAPFPPRSANAWDRPIKLPVTSAQVATVKKETLLEDYSSWGQESATPTVDQENIWRPPPSATKRSKQGKGPAIPQTLVSTTSAESTQPSAPQIRNDPSISSTSRDLPPHQNFGALAELQDDSDCEDIYAPMSKMNFTNIVNAWERGDVDAVEPGTSEAQSPATEDQTYAGNTWASQEDPRAIPVPDLICPTHHIACRTGICEDMTKLKWAKRRKEEQEKWEKKKKNKGKRKKKASESGDDDDENKAAEVDADNFSIVRPKGNRRQFGKQQNAQDTPEVEEPPSLGRMRAFPADLPSGHVDDEGAGAPNDAPEPEE